MGDVSLVVNPSIRWPDPDHGPWRVTFYWANDGGRSRLIGLDLHGFDGDGIGPAGEEPLNDLTTSVWRSVPVVRLANGALRDVREWLASDGPPGALGDALTGGPPRKRPRLTTEDLERVAAVYRSGERSPTKAVAEAFFLSQSGAVKRVQKARRAGLL